MGCGVTVDDGRRYLQIRIAWNICGRRLRGLKRRLPLFRDLARGFLSRRPASERAVELIEQRQAHLWSTPCGAQPIVVLGIKLCERYGGPLLYQLVQTHTACPCEVLEPLVLGSRQTDGQCRHCSTPSKALTTSAKLPASGR